MEKKFTPENGLFLALFGLLSKLELLLLLNFAHCHFYLGKSLLNFLFSTTMFYLGITIFASSCNSNMSTLWSDAGSWKNLGGHQSVIRESSESHQRVIRESSDNNYTLIMCSEQHCVKRTSLSFLKFHSHCLIYL